MKKINKHNYEAFYLDYLEGNLKGDLLDEFLLFKQQNADLFNENEDFITEATLKPNYSEKISSKIQLPENIEEHLIAYAEENLSKNKLKEVNAILQQYPFLQKDLAYYNIVKLHHDNHIVFPNKERLKKSGVAIALTSEWLKVAAAILLIGIMYLFSEINLTQPHYQTLPRKLSLITNINTNNKDALANNFIIKSKKHKTTDTKHNVKKHLKHYNEQLEHLQPKTIKEIPIQQPATILAQRQVKFKPLKKQVLKKSNIIEINSVPEAIVFLTHKTLLNKSQKEINEETLTAVSQRIKPLNIIQNETEKIISFTTNKFSFSRKISN